jgi:hypothetical protein
VSAPFGGVGCWTVRMSLAGVRAEPLRPLPLLDAIEERPPTTSTIFRADHASEATDVGTSLVRRLLPFEVARPDENDGPMGR